jgi:membrane protease subunit HflC
MNKKLAILGAVVIVLGFVLSQSLFIVRETEQALVLQFGEPRQVIQEPGLQLKIPFIQQVQFYEKRVLSVDPPVEQVILADQRRLDVDSFVRYRIVDPLLFFQTVTDENGAQQRITTVTISSLRRVLGNATQLEVLSEERADLMNQIQQAVETSTDQFGVSIVDVRIGRADVPEGTVQSVYDRMRSEREREAAEFRAQGFEQAQQIRSRAERERTVILAEAQRESQIIRGRGDAEAIRIAAEAYDQDADFFNFYRTLQAYRNSLQAEDTTMVLSPTGDFFRYFQNLGQGEAFSQALLQTIAGEGGSTPEPSDGDIPGVELPETEPLGPIDVPETAVPDRDEPATGTPEVGTEPPVGAEPEAEGESEN